MAAGTASVWGRGLALALAAALGGLGRAKPTIPEENIPADAKPEVRRYLEQLYSRDPITRAYACVHLGRMGDPAEPALPFLVAMLGDDTKLEWEVKEADPTNPLEEAKKRILGFYKEKETSPGREAARALSKLCTAAREDLLAAAKDPSASVRRHAAEALGGIRDRKATPPLTLLLKDPEKDVRAQAARALGRLRDPAAVEALIAAMKDPERDVRREVAGALGEIKDPRALDVLLAALTDTVDVRTVAEAALLETRDLRAVEPLIVYLRHRKEEVRRISARLLGAIGDPRALKPLVQALKDAASDVRFEAASALRRMSGEDFGEDPQKWQRWQELEAAARSIEERIAGDRVHAYTGALQTADWASRAYAAKALGLLGDRRGATALRGALWDKDVTVRRNAAVSLGALGDPQAVEPLIASLSDAEPEVQEAAEDALRRITGANHGRDTRKWQEWWDEHKRAVFARDREKAGDEASADPSEQAAGGDLPAPRGSGTLTMVLIAVLIAVLPATIFITLRVLRPR